MSSTHQALRATGREFYRYFFAGLAAFGADFVALVLLTEGLGVNYLVANACGVSLGILVSYVLCVRWVFTQRRFSQVSIEVPAFVLTSLVGLVLNEALLWLFVEIAALYYLWAKILVTGLMFIVNFLLKKLVVFSGQVK